MTTTTPPETETSNTDYLVVHSGSAAKLGANSQGAIHYAVLTDSTRSNLFFALTGNDGGGYFSREILPTDNIRTCMPEEGAATKSSAFKAAFVGLSQNNSSFLATCLVDQNLLTKRTGEAAGRGTMLEVATPWPEWEAQTLEPIRDGSVELPVFRIKPASVPAEQPTDPTDDVGTVGNEPGESDQTSDEAVDAQGEGGRPDNQPKKPSRRKARHG
jgi:hypothetical protein